ncbi:FHA domain-containing protein [Roseobacter sp. S98]|uniref:FHA domain-containing protein n=1 Tax=Roseobacter algicola (ex Choi et al. 2025) (nom. illeg.) TaxID=3092138 RepID=UPI0035C70C57
MKFIRDIINEKRSNGPVSASMPAEENQLDFAADYEDTSSALDLGQYRETTADPVTDNADAAGFSGIDYDPDEFDPDGFDGSDWEDEDAAAYDDQSDEMTLEAARRAIEDASDEDAAGDPLDRLFSEQHVAGAEEESHEDFSDEDQSWDAYEDEEDDSPVPAPASLAEMRRAMAGERQAVRAVPPAPAPMQDPAHEQTDTSMADSADLLEMPAPMPGRAAQGSGRVKTRLLGFATDTDAALDPIEKAARAGQARFPVAWMVVVAGPGRGASFTLQDGVSRIGRAEDQTVALNFGDNAISRENHVSVAYDSEQNSFFIGHSGKANLVRINDRPLLSTETISDGDLVRIGETTLRLVTLCGDDFTWNDEDEKDAKYA